jgi:hypothetical protein
VVALAAEADSKDDPGMTPTTIGMVAGLGAVLGGAILTGSQSPTSDRIGGALIFSGIALALGSGVVALTRAPNGLFPHEALEAREEDSEVQTLLFPRSKYTTAQAKAWAKRHGYKFAKVDIRPETIRIRQHVPSRYKRLRTIELGRDVSAVVGFT